MKDTVASRSCPKDNVATVNQLRQLQQRGHTPYATWGKREVMKAIKNGGGLTGENRYEGRRKMYEDVKSEN